MAIVIAKFDSETKQMSVTIDGEDQGDVSYFSCYSDKCCGDEGEDRYYGGASVQMRSREVNGVVYSQSAYASIPMTPQEKLTLSLRDALARK